MNESNAWAEGWVLIIAALTIAIPSIIAAVFTGISAARTSHVGTAVAEVHAIVNSKSDAQLAMIAALREEVAKLQEAAIAKSDEALSKAEQRSQKE